MTQKSGQRIRRRPSRAARWRGRLRCRPAGMSSPRRSWARRWVSPRAAPRTCCGLAHALAVSLPGTRAAFRSGIVSQRKAAIIAEATALLDPAEARAAEAMVLDRAGSLTPAGLRAAIARAVMQVAPDKARKRREQAAKNARVERWAEASGNAGLAGRELPPARCWPPTSGSPRGQGAAQGGPGGRHGRAAGPGLPGHLARHGLPARRATRRRPGSGAAGRRRRRQQWAWTL